MAETSEKKPTTGQIFLGLGILLFIVVIAVGMLSLGNPYYAISQVALFATALIFIVFRLKECFQLAKDSPYKPKLNTITFFLVLGIFPVISHLNDVFQSKDHNFIELALNVCTFFSLLFTLELVAALLKKEKTRTNDVSPPEIVQAKV